MGGMEYTQLESLIPLKDDHRIGDGMKLELEKKRADVDIMDMLFYNW